MNTSWFKNNIKESIKFESQDYFVYESKRKTEAKCQYMQATIQAPPPLPKKIMHAKPLGHMWFPYCNN